MSNLRFRPFVSKGLISFDSGLISKINPASGGILRASIALVLPILCSCASVSSYQTARTIPGGTVRLFVGAGYSLNPEQQTNVIGGVTFREVHLPVFEGGLRIGISDRWDVGFKLTAPGTASLDGKYQFFKGDELAMSLGAGAAYVAVTASSQNEESQLSAHVVDAILPFYISYHFSPVFAVYANPKYVHRIYVRGSTPSQGFAGSAVGVRWGNSVGLFLEGAYLRDLSSGANLLQGGLACLSEEARPSPGRCRRNGERCNATFLIPERCRSAVPRGGTGRWANRCAWFVEGWKERAEG